jgi:hypothetical protein
MGERADYSEARYVTLLSSSGLTGRSSTPRPLGFIIAVSGILDPRLAPSLKLRRPTVMPPGEALA